MRAATLKVNLHTQQYCVQLINVCYPDFNDFTLPGAAMVLHVVAS